MGLFIRAVITGFGYSLGKALFDEVQRRAGLDRSEKQPQRVVVVNPEEIGHPEESRSD
jgi:hypothetical protein